MEVFCESLVEDDRYIKTDVRPFVLFNSSSQDHYHVCIKGQDDLEQIMPVRVIEPITHYE